MMQSNVNGPSPLRAQSPIAQDALIAVPLSQRPIIIAMGLGVHGLVRRETYVLPDLWCLHLYRYEAQLKIDGRPFAIHPGSISLVAPGQRLDYLFDGRSQHLYVHFKFDPPGTHDASCMDTPVMQDGGDNFGRIYGSLAEMIGCPAEQRSRADARLWEALWQLRSGYIATASAGFAQTGRAIPGAVAKAVQMIESKLDQKISVRKVASDSGVSYGYLSQLFQQAIGKSAAEYINSRRMERATNLLKRSDLPIKAIAAMVGYVDLQQFNKAIRRFTGRSPRDVRRDSMATISAPGDV